MRMLPSGASSVVATIPRTSSNGNGEANDLGVGANNSIYYTDNHAIRRIDQNGAVSIVAQDFDLTNSPSIPGTHASEGPYLRGLSIKSDGTIFVASTSCGRVVKADGHGTANRWEPSVQPFGARKCGEQPVARQYSSNLSAIPDPSTRRRRT